MPPQDPSTETLWVDVGIGAEDVDEEDWMSEVLMVVDEEVSTTLVLLEVGEHASVTVTGEAVSVVVVVWSTPGISGTVTVEV